MHQLSFLFRTDESFLCSFLRQKINKDISLVITDNSSSLISVRTERNSVMIRIHRIFLGAGDDVLNEVSDFIKYKKTPTARINSFISENSRFIRSGPARSFQVRTQGKHFELQGLFNSLNREYFDNRVSASITWGSNRVKRSVRKRTLGSYSPRYSLIRIHPLLDRKDVPQYFLEFVIYHEMLHADIGTEPGGMKRSLHSKRFRAQERLFKDYHRAILWEKQRWG